MGTAVFHPQDYLAASQRDRNGQFSCASECPSSVTKPCRRAFSVTSEALAPLTGCGRDVASGNARPDQGCILGRKKALAGLLPVPGQVLQSAYTSAFRRSPSVPMLDSTASACIPMNGIQIHERRLDARQFVNFPQGDCMAGSWYCAILAARQKLNYSGSSHVSDVFKHGRTKWAGVSDQRVEYRKTMQPEVARGEAYLGRKHGRPPSKVLPNSQEPICTSTPTVGMKHGVSKQLKRSASEKRQEMLEVPILQRPGTATDINLTSSAPASSTADRKRVKGLRAQVSVDANPHGRIYGVNTGMTRSSQACKRSLVASLEKKCYGSVNIALRCNDKIKGDKVVGVAGCVWQDPHDASSRDVEKTCNGKLECNMRRREPMVGSKLISGRFNSVMHDTNGMWVSLMNDERWAGPSFVNSPSPSSLPVPSFTFKFSRTTSAGSSDVAKGADYVSHIPSNGSLVEEKRSQDVAFATNDLRRMLNLDHASGDM